MLHAMPLLYALLCGYRGPNLFAISKLLMDRTHPNYWCCHFSEDHLINNTLLEL